MTSDRWDGGGKPSYVREMLRGATDETLRELDLYLAGVGDPESEPWSGDGRFPVFISHIAGKKLVAHEIKSALAGFGVEGFVAHEDIEPGKEWLSVIEAALHSSKALVGLLHTGFRESNWCDQEVGIAFGRGIPGIPVKYDIDPYGFLGTVQAIVAGPQTQFDIAKKIVQILLADKRTAADITESIVSRLAGAWSYAQANQLSTLLVENTGAVTWEQVQRLREAQKANSQVRDAYDVEGALSRIETIVAASPQSASGPIDWNEPF